MPFNTLAFLITLAIATLIVIGYLCVEVIVRHQWLPVRIVATVVTLLCIAAIVGLIAP